MWVDCGQKHQQLSSEMSILTRQAKHFMENQAPQPITQSTPQIETASPSLEVVTEKVNIYPMIRHLMLILCILFALGIVAFLFYQNGKIIYGKGL